MLAISTPFTDQWWTLALKRGRLRDAAELAQRLARYVSDGRCCIVTNVRRWKRIPPPSGNKKSCMPGSMQPALSSNGDAPMGQYTKPVGFCVNLTFRADQLSDAERIY